MAAKAWEVIITELGSREATKNRMERRGLLTGPDGLLKEVQRPDRSELKSTKAYLEERRSLQEAMCHISESVLDEWDL